MFEVIATVCLLASPETCREVLIPGGERQDETACRAEIAELSPEFDPTVSVSALTCKPLAKIANFVEVAEGVYAHLGQISDAATTNYGDVSNTGFVIGSTSIAVVDTGGSRKIAEEMYRAIRQRSDLPVSHAILTHMHPDHVLGASVFADIGARIVGHTKLATALADRSATYLTNFGNLMGAAQFIGTSVQLPEITVDQEMEIDLGGRILQLRSWQTSHTTNDLTVFDPTSGVMFTGDLVFHDHAPALDGSVRGWVAVLDEMAGLPVKKIVPGHGGPLLNWPEGGAPLVHYLDVLIRDTKQALDRGESLNTAAENIATQEAPNWQLFELFNPRNATVAFTELEWE